MFSSKNEPVERPAGARRGLRGLALLTTVGWIVAGLLIADKIYAQNMTSSLHNALVRSQTERHELSQELQRMSGEMAALQDRLSRFQQRQSQASATP
jgi:hypothetical protein